jgi:hypothetical protein
MQPVAVCEIVGCSLAMVMEVYSHLTDEQRWRAFMRILESERHRGKDKRRRESVDQDRNEPRGSK